MRASGRCDLMGRLDVMGRSSALRMKLMLLNTFLIVSTNAVCLRGNLTKDLKYNLHCVNDYLFTINCSLSIAPAENTSDSDGSYRLTFTETLDETTFQCTLTVANGLYFCSVRTSYQIPEDHYATFGETDNFKISLYHSQNNGPDTCEVLDEMYWPMMNIKPNAPCCLAVRHNSSQRHFAWKSTYEKYSDVTGLPDKLKYQLHFHQTGDTHNASGRVMSTDHVTLSVDDENFVADTEYGARVRSSPAAFYHGQWSDWSSEVQWRTEPAVNGVPSNPFIFWTVRLFIPMCAMLLLLLLLCYAPLKNLRWNVFIPTPAPYFQTLYSDCQGDFKSWVVTQDKTADMLKAEETLWIDTIARSEEDQEEPQEQCQLKAGNTYVNVTDPPCDTTILGTPYAVSTMATSAPQSLTLSSQPGSPAEGDSGCWLYSHMDPPLYCNEYCTLSAFQQSSPGPQERQRSSSVSGD